MKVIEAPRSFPLQAPNVCFICEQSPFEDEAIVDVQRNFEAQVGRSHLDGRKYVCARCVDEMAGLFGFASPAEAEQLKEDAASAKAEAEAAEKRVALQEAIEKATAELSVAKDPDPIADPQPEKARKPRAKAAKKDA